MYSIASKVSKRTSTRKTAIRAVNHFKKTVSERSGFLENNVPPEM